MASDHRDDADQLTARAAALAGRALQEAEEALRHRSAGATPDDLEVLEEAVRRAHGMVEAAQRAAASARGENELARRRLENATHPLRRLPRPILKPATWGRRAATCPACGQGFVVRYRCTAHTPDGRAEVPCPEVACAARVAVTVPESAYAFSTRRGEKR